MLDTLNCLISRQVHNVGFIIRHPYRRLASDIPILFLDFNCDVCSASLDEKAGKAMSAMSNYYLDLQTEAIRYLVTQGIDEESLWDAAEESYSLVIALSEMHHNGVSIDTIKRIVSEAQL